MNNNTLIFVGMDTHKEFTEYVVAPSLIPKKPGQRIKTDKRDALMLMLMIAHMEPFEDRPNGATHR